MVGAPHCNGADGDLADAMIRRMCIPHDLPAMDCYMEREERFVAQDVARLGVSAVPALERALAAFEREGVRASCPDRWAWIPLIYAKVQGEASFPRLRTFSLPSPHFLATPLTAAFELSLNLTSYVSATEEPAALWTCYRAVDEPRNALNAVVLGWLRNDRKWMESRLSSAGRLSLRRRGSWRSLRKGFPHGRRPASLAVAYRFLMPGAWSTPSEPLDQVRGRPLETPDLARPEIDTEFFDGLGRVCGRYQVHFVREERNNVMFRHYYLVSDDDLTELIKVISACAGQADPVTPNGRGERSERDVLER